MCMDCCLVQPGRVYYVEAWEDQERITVMPREGYKPIHHWHERLAQYHLPETAICPAHWVVIIEALLNARPKALCKETFRKILWNVKLQRYNENWLQLVEIDYHQPFHILSMRYMGPVGEVPLIDQLRFRFTGGPIEDLSSYCVDAPFVELRTMRTSAETEGRQPKVDSAPLLSDRRMPLG